MSLTWMFKCEEVSRKVSDAMDRRLPWPQRLGIRFHLMMCRYCSRFEEHLRLIRDFCRHEPGSDLAPDACEELTADARSRLKELLKRTS